MDRLDTWLSTQHGWRLLLVRCVTFAPFGLGAGSLWSDRVTFDPATPQLHPMVTRMELCVAGSLLLAAVTLLPRSWRGHVRRAERTIWPTWRMLAAACSFNATFAVGAYEQAEPEAWGWRNSGWVFLLQLALFCFSVVMCVWNARYLSRLRRLRRLREGDSLAGWQK